MDNVLRTPPTDRGSWGNLGNGVNPARGILRKLAGKEGFQSYHLEYDAISCLFIIAFVFYCKYNIILIKARKRF